MIKKVLYEHCLKYVEQRLARIKDEIQNLQASANEETKNSSGDKYETGRAMAQLEVEKSLQQLKEAQNLYQTLKKINPTIQTNRIIPGSLVTTSQGNFYIAISLGLFKHDQHTFVIISGDAPVGKLLVGKQAGDSFYWNHKTVTITSFE